jgi:hypothetical protein
MTGKKRQAAASMSGLLGLGLMGRLGGSPALTNSSGGLWRSGRSAVLVDEAATAPLSCIGTVALADRALRGEGGAMRRRGCVARSIVELSAFA